MQLKGRAEVDRWTLGRLDGEAALPARRIEDGADVSCWVLVDLHASFGTQGLVEAFVEARCVERLLIRRKESSRLCQSQQTSDHDGQQIHTHMLPDERRTVRGARRSAKPGHSTFSKWAGLWLCEERWLGQFVSFVWFISCISCPNPTNQTNETNQMN